MTPQTNLQTVRQYYSCIHEHDLDQTVSFASENVEWQDMATGTHLRGKEGFRKSNQYWLTAFPDTEIQINTIFESGEFVVVEYLARGTHQGAIVTPNGTFQATGRRVEMNFCDIIRLSNGKIESGRSYYDLMTLLTQVGLATSTLQAAA